MVSVLGGGSGVVVGGGVIGSTGTEILEHKQMSI